MRGELAVAQESFVCELLLCIAYPSFQCINNGNSAGLDQVAGSERCNGRFGALSALMR